MLQQHPATTLVQVSHSYRCHFVNMSCYQAHKVSSIILKLVIIINFLIFAFDFRQTDTQTRSCKHCNVQHFISNKCRVNVYLIAPVRNCPAQAVDYIQCLEPLSIQPNMYPIAVVTQNHPISPKYHLVYNALHSTVQIALAHA